MIEPQQMWARRCLDGKLEHFMLSRFGVQMCGVPSEEIVRVRLTPDDDGPFWCWYDYRERRITLVFGSLLLLSTCFTYGIDVAEKCGSGIRLRARAEAVEDTP